MVTIRTAANDDVGAVLSFWSSSAMGGERPSDTASAVASLITRDSELQNIVFTNPQIRDQTIRHFLNRAVRTARL